MIKRNQFLHAAIVATLMSTTGIALAGGTHTIAVSASVTGTCIVNTSNSTLAFGALDPGSGGTVSAVWSGGTFRCTNGTAYTIASNDGLWSSAAGGANNRMRLSTATDCSTATNCVRYTMTKAANGTGSGMTTNISFAVTGTTGIADYQNAAAGSYADTVTLTVAP
ncbi:MAG: spore coat protein U domain-containing protein [Betaproteobacteria bacterium]